MIGACSTIPNIFTATVRIIDRRDREVVISYGSPARPVVVPIANVDFEPIGFMDHPRGEAGAYRLTMDRAVAKDIGLTV
jgi:hypothetical protein